MIDPQTLIGMKLADAIKLLSEFGASYNYTYMDRRANRQEKDFTRPERYNLQIDENDVVVRSRLG